MVTNVPWSIDFPENILKSPPVGQCETAYNGKLFDQERYYGLSVIGTEVSRTHTQLL